MLLYCTRNLESDPRSSGTIALKRRVNNTLLNWTNSIRSQNV